jgi:hypothetical protein
VGAAGALATGAIWAASAAGAAPTRSLTPGQCTGRATVTMQLQRSDPGKLEAGFEVNHAKPGSVWQVRLTHNGTTYFSGQRSAGRDGSFSIDRVLPNRAGTDQFRGRATNLSSGQVCTVTASA